MMPRNGSIVSESSGISCSSSSNNNYDYYDDDINDNDLNKTGSSFDSSVFYIFEPKVNNENDNHTKKVKFVSSLHPANQIHHRVRHANLETQSLTLKQKFKLARIYYMRKINIFRLLFIGFCIPMFFITSSKVWDQYVNHKTVVNIQYLTPTISNIPSVTVCVHIGKLAYRQDQCVADQLKNYIKSKDAIEQCILTTSTLVANQSENYNCSEVLPVVISHQFGFKCFTYFSDFYGNWTRMSEDEKIKYRLNFSFYPQIEITISKEFLKDFDKDKTNRIINNPLLLDNSTKVYLMIHSPSLLPFMQDTGSHFLIPNNQLIIRFNKKIENLLPPPFHTNCFESYGEDSTMEPPIQTLHDETFGNNKHYYRSQGECWMYCLWRGLSNGCLNYYSVFSEHLLELEEKYFYNQTENDKSGYHSESCVKYCPANKQTHTEYWDIMDKCSEKCRPPCLDRTFSISKSYSEKSDKTSIKILWANEPVLQISHHGLTSTTSFMGNIGGHVHVWLGLSVVEIFRYFVHLVRSRQFTNVFCCLYRWVHH